MVNGIEARTAVVPVEPAAAFATRLVDRREYVVVTARDRDGQEGVGYTYAGTRGAAIVAEIVTELIAPVLVGRPVDDLEENWARVYQELLLLGRRGAVLRALSAVDIALWDLIGKRRGEPLHRMLGSAATSVPAYASGGYYRGGDPLEELREQLDHYVALGFSDYKIKFGRLGLRDDIARVNLAREVIGPESRLALDINNGWPDLATAIAACEALAGLAIWWIEEPFSPDDLASHAALAQRSAIPVATGEIEATRWGFAALIERHAAHILQPDVCVAGGISEFVKIAHTADAFALPVAPHWHANLHAPLVAAAPSGLTVEYFDAELNIFNFDRLLANPLSVSGGRIALSEEPGIGVIFDQEALMRYKG
jgi:L-alanine-DL-glutamate epimerase-like enolase superfamily enzyme